MKSSEKTDKPDKSAVRRRSRLWRITKWSLVTLGVIVLILIALLVWIATTRSGLAFAWNYGHSVLPANLRIAQVKGRLIGPLHVRGVVMDTSSMHVSIKALDLDWSASDLLHATVHVNRFAMNGVDYRAKKASAPPEKKKSSGGFNLPDQVNLPVAAQIDAVDLDNITIQSAPEAQPFTIESARVRDVHVDNDHWRIASLTGHGPRFKLDANARIVPKNGYPTRLSARAKLTMANLAPIKANARITGQLDDLSISAGVDSPYNLSLQGSVKNALDQPRVDLTLKADQLAAHAIRSSLPKLTASTQVDVAGPIDDLAIDLTANADSPTYGKANVNGRVHYTPSAVDIKQLRVSSPQTQGVLNASGQMALAGDRSVDLDIGWSRLQWPLAGAPRYETPRGRVTVTGALDDLAIKLNADADSPAYGKAQVNGRVHYTPSAVDIKHLDVTTPQNKGRLTASGQVALTGDRAMNLAVNWSDLAWPLAGKPTYRSPDGQLKLTGSLKDYDLTGSLGWQVVGQTKGELALVGHGSQNAFDLSKLSVTGGPGDIDGRAHVQWAPALQAKATINGKHINPAAVVAGIPGDFDFKLDATAKQSGQTLTAHVSQLTANGSLRHQPLKLAAKLDYLGDHVDIDHLDLQTGSTSAHVQGRFGWQPGSRLDGRLAVESSDLSTLWPGLAGRLHAKAKLAGRLDKPNVDATIRGHGLAYQAYRLKKASVNADVDWSGAQQSNVTARLAGIEAAGQTIQTVALDADGTPAKHHITLNVDSDMAKLGAAVDGSLKRSSKKPPGWRFRLTKLDVAYQKLAPWHLAKPASGVVSASRQTLDDACLASGDARLCIDAEHNARASSARINLHDLAFNYVKPFLPDNMDVGGALSGRITASVPAAGTPDIKANLNTSAGHVTVTPANDKPVRVLSLKPGDIRLAMKNGGITSSVDLPLADGGGVNVDARLAPGQGAFTKRKLDGRVRLQLDKLGFVSQLSPQITAIDGGVNGDIRLSGTVARPNILGQLKLAIAKLVLAAPGLTLTDIRLAATGHGNTIGVDGEIHSGGGQITTQGQVGLRPEGQSVSLAVNGHDFQAINIPDVTAYISPDLKLSVTPERIDVNGRLEIPKASITPRDLPASGVQTVSSDQVIVGQKQPVAEAAARKVHANIKVILGKNVHVEGFGLKTDVTGDLRVRQEPKQPTTGSGRIDLVNGSYKAYGQNLDIQKGQILFGGGPISEPALDVKAARYPADDVTVGVHVRGSLKQPRLQLFSKPPMTQSEQLSWLLLGRPPSGNTGAQQSMIAKAALALGSGRANSVLNKLGKNLGVDEIGIGSGAGHSSSEAAFTVGKYLTPKLYLGYGLGLFDAVSTVSLRYSLNSHWTLKTESSTEATGGDVVYSIDK